MWSTVQALAGAAEALRQPGEGLAGVVPGLLLSFMAAGDLLAGRAGQTVRVGSDRVQRGQLVVDGHDGIPVLRGGPLANLPLQLLDLLPGAAPPRFGFLARFFCASPMVRSRTLSSRWVSASNRPGLSLSTPRRASLARLVGSSSARGIRASSTRMGMTRDITRRSSLDLQPNKSPGLSRRRCPSWSVIVSHRLPISASSTSQDPTAVVISSTKSSPSSIESTSLKT